MKTKRAKLVKKKKISVEDVSQIEAIYKLRPLLATGVYLTPILHAKSTNVRLSFAEFNFTLGVNSPVSAIVMSVEDLQNTYNAITELLQQMRTLGRIA